MSHDPAPRTRTRIVLKTNAKRTVEREAAPDGRAHAVKRYHAPRIGGWFDGLRARAEFRVLEQLFARGLAVPRAIEVRHGGTWELVTEWIEDAHALDRILRGEAPWPAASATVAQSLGRLLAEAHAIGLDHPDLHPGNVLVGAGGRTWLVDVRRARIRAQLDARERLHDLIHVAAGVRETVSARFRARFFAAYARALPIALRGVLEPHDTVVRDIERAARRLRREHVERARLRWTRSSSSCRAVRTPAFEGIASRALADDDVERCVALALTAPTGSATSMRLGSGDELLALPLHGTAAAVRASWLAAVQLADHHLDVARPLAWHRGPRAWAMLALPSSVRAVQFDTDPAFAAFFDALHDRGIALREPERALWFRDEHGRVFAAGVRGLEPR
ncbi:MAG: lipopolysaccharide kinase InaA family protein [Planctomycetota bacterium]